MTAEIGVLNKLGVALAADSAVTLGPSAGKVYTSADKLFQLSESAPVGIMIYGNANFIDVPWEAIIKIFRRQLGENRFDTLKEYSNEFINFIKTDKTLFPEDVQSKYIEFHISNYFYSLRKKFYKHLSEKFKKGKLKEKEILNFFFEIIDNDLKNIKKKEKLDDIPKDLDKQIRKQYEKKILEIEKNIFEKLPIKKNVSAKLLTIVVESLIRKRSDYSQSGIVIAGFGEKEHFPNLIEFKLNGMILNNPLYFLSNNASVGISSSAYIIPFAQNEMVHTFMEGIDPYLRDMIEKSIISLFQGVSDVIIKAIKDKDQKYSSDLEKQIEPLLINLMQDLFKKWHKERNDYYSSPIMEIVASLPKDELAAIAESLVNLTKFKRRVSKQQETVGGPIDVAVITKGDGFIWVKRKHYFEAELNPRYMAKHYKGDN